MEFLQTIKEKLTEQKTLKFLNEPKVIDWLFYNPYKNIPISQRQKLENEWGKRIVNHNSCQWTTELSETIAKELLTLYGYNPIKKTYRTSEGKKITPDLETEDAIYEIKCRTWNTTGTAGEKILGVPYKYAELPRISGKPLIIVLMAFQEEDNFGIFTTKSKEKRKLLLFWKSMDIIFVKFTDLLKQYAYSGTSSCIRN